MSFDTAQPANCLTLKDVGKCYRRYHKPSDWLKERIFRRAFSAEHWALREVSLSLSAGESLGIVGKNGAGKSTLLQLLAGTLTPSHGQITRHGRIAALLELGAGFNPDFTGLEY